MQRRGRSLEKPVSRVVATVSIGAMTDESAAPEPPAHSYLVLMPPFCLKENFTAESLIGVQSGWGPLLISGVIGRNHKDEPCLIIASEIPYNWLRPVSPIPKGDLEILHLQRLATDHRAVNGFDLYDAITPVAPGSDPPDIYADLANERIGWELTVFGPKKRREAQALFMEVIKRLALQQRHRIGHLFGYHISMWFGTADDPTGLPFKSNDATAYNLIVEALVAHQPDPNQFQVPGNRPPEKIESIKPVRTVNDVSFMSSPMLGGAPATPFYAMTGMSVGLGFQSDHVASEEWARLRAVVAKKDKPTNDVLLISVGAPDVLGRCFIGEEILANFMLSHPEEVFAEHLSSVVLHFWSTGQAVELLGSSPKLLWPAAYQGMSLTTHPFASRAQ